MTKKSVPALFGYVPLFAGCSARERAAIATASKKLDHPAGKVILREGELGIGFFLIESGTVQVTVKGRKRARLGPGDFFGEIALLDGGQRSATVTAESPTVIYGLTEWKLKPLLNSHPGMVEKLLEAMAARIRSVETGILD